MTAHNMEFSGLPQETGLVGGNHVPGKAQSEQVGVEGNTKIQGVFFYWTPLNLAKSQD